MSKKRVIIEESETKPREYFNIFRMTDKDFIENAELLSKPFYDDYMNSRVNRDVAVDYYFSKMDVAQTVNSTLRPIEEPDYTLSGTQNRKAKKKVFEKRRFVPILNALLFAAMTVVCLLGFFNVKGIGTYVGIYVCPYGNVQLLHPFVGAINTLVGARGSYPFDAYLTNSEVGLPACLAVTGATVYAALIIVGLIKSIYEIFVHKSRYTYKGLLAIAAGMLASVVVMLVAGIALGGLPEFFLPRGRVFGVGLGLYILLVAPLLVMIFARLSYKRIE